MQARHEELKVKAKLLLEKAQRESFDQKNTHPCDEDHQPPQQQQQSVDNTVTAVTQSSAGAGEFSVRVTVVIHFTLLFLLLRAC